MKELEYEVLNHGQFFTVVIVGDVVIKIPKHPEVQKQEKLDFIAKHQTYLSEHIEEIMPCKSYIACLVMSRANGVQADSKEAEPYVKRIMELMQKVRDEALALGYKARDISRPNVYYSAEEDKLYVFDLHRLRLL